MAVSERKVAIACQGGGSHTAFTAGVLKRLLSEKERLDAGGYRITALSGTSGGAICALLAWYGLVQDDWPGGVRRLDAFWRENTAHEPWDAVVNQWVGVMAWLGDYVALPALSPYLFPPWAGERLRAMLEAQVDFARIPALVQRQGPALLVAAASVLSGRFKVFKGKHVTVDAVLASAAIPTIFRSVRIRGLPYWDGLFSQNPPVRDLIDNVEPPSVKPDEIWVVQINPLKRRTETQGMGEILDRRNELAGNLSLQQELYHIRKINELIRKGVIQDTKYKPVAVRIIALDAELAVESKLDRSPAFIEGMLRTGEKRAGEFLDVLAERPKAFRSRLR